ncbi:ester cyclase [Streptomyces sp. UNOB3_S3]|uniref:ester cyclase n=1 Tax=Streptomyces sp. UNOB3_S3 TaxID=2871682 RepID=UPI001E365D65|nr:ester cyclase [Streptomyces sp. UNOB3_S3]MCC3778619.1 ester cyclase [Streptomyces sp. UNOB3_S3]
MGSTEQANKALVRELIDTWNRGDLAGMTRFWSPDMVHHGRDGEPLPGAGVAAEMARFMSAFPDLRLTVHAMVAEGDLVATRLTVEATHKGEYLGVPATGRAVRVPLLGQLRVADGAVVEHWGVADGLYLLEQLGLLPPELLRATA